MDPGKSTPSSSSSSRTGLSSPGPSTSQAAAAGSSSPASDPSSDVQFAPGGEGANRRYYPLSSACAKALMDKVYEKRKAGATEVEK